MAYNYLGQGACNRRYLFVCLLATLRKNLRMDLHENNRDDWQWAIEQTVKFWYRSGSPSEYRDCFPYSSLLGKWLTDINLLLILIRQMAALVRRALAEVCKVTVLLVTSGKVNNTWTVIYFAHGRGAKYFKIRVYMSRCALAFAYLKNQMSELQ